VSEDDLETLTMSRPWPTKAVEPLKKNVPEYWHVVSTAMAAVHIGLSCS
jgi:hypothetical protein